MFYSHSKQITYPWYMCERYDMATVQRGHQRERPDLILKLCVFVLIISSMTGKIAPGLGRAIEI
jgi:hypothetical protein